VRSAWRRRSPLIFFVASAVACWLLALGPVPAASGRPWLPFSPYEWFMLVPGVGNLRVPARFWMPATLMLAAAAGVAWSRLMAGRSGRIVIVWTVLAGAIVLADGWVHPFVVSGAPPVGYGAEAPAPDRTVLEWPIGVVDADIAAMLRARSHGLATANGHSGFVPVHYYLLQRFFAACELSALDALRRFGDLTLLVRREGRPVPCGEGLLDRAARYRQAQGGPLLLEIDRLPAGTDRRGQRFLTPRMQRASISQHLLPAAVDGRLDTAWHTDTQRPGDFLDVAVDADADVTGVELSLGVAFEDYPRGLRIDAAGPEGTWRPLESSPVPEAAVLGAIAEPTRVPMLIEFAPVRVRRLRLVQTGANAVHPWTVAELRIRVREAARGPDAEGAD
jgi:hypothetical protein